MKLSAKAKLTKTVNFHGVQVEAHQSAQYLAADMTGKIWQFYDEPFAVDEDPAYEVNNCWLSQAWLDIKDPVARNHIITAASVGQLDTAIEDWQHSLVFVGYKVGA